MTEITVHPLFCIVVLFFMRCHRADESSENECAVVWFFLLISLVFVPAVPVGAASADIKQVEDFCQYKANTFPDGWRFSWFQESKAKRIYTVKVDEPCYLEANAVNSAVPIAKEFQYDLTEYPFLHWEWQVLAFPKGGDERFKNTGDSAAAVYVIFPGKVRPNTIKYVWSASLPVGTSLESPYSSKTKIVVLRNHLSSLKGWTAEKVNVYRDYKTLFGRAPEPVEAIGIMSDSDNTASRSAARYRAIQISKK